MSTPSMEVGSVLLAHETIIPIQQLNGFQKNHRVPTSDDAQAVSFLNSLADPVIDVELQEYFTRLRKSYGLKRKELNVEGPSEGHGVITTPFFQYSIESIVNAEIPANSNWRRVVSQITEPARVFAGPFEQVFGNRFNQLEVRATFALDLEAIVDHIEDAELANVDLEYDKNLIWCEVQMKDLQTSVRLTGNLIQLIARKETGPQQMFENFVEAKNRFMETLNWKQDSFLPAAG